MKTKIIYSTFSCLLFLGMAMPGAAFANEHGQNYKATYNGTTFDALSYDLSGNPSPVNVVRASGKGTFGQSDTASATQFVPDYIGVCESNYDVRFTVVHSTDVSTYSTGEQLYASSVEGYLCVNSSTGDFEGMTTGEFDGGTGRFANAHGNFESPFSGRNLTLPAGLPYGFGSINGITTGTLYLK